ncbi:MAG: patatin-like phospholipase family protein [Gemmatimonadales bacterium]|jgi:NTE family protein
MTWLLVLALLQVPLASQGAGRPERAAPTTIGLALSGGSAKGFAHIGVLRVFEGAGLPIDAIAGTSMGALIGGLYAIGYTPDMLEELAVEQDWEALFTDRYDRRSWTIERKLARESLLELPIRGQRPQLPAGLVAGQRISQLFTGLTWPAHAVDDFRSFTIPFVALATDLETGDAVPLDTGLLPRAMRASISIPTVFAPVRIGDRLLADGGLSRNLPAQDVADLGADIIICVDVSDPLASADSIRTLLDVLDQSISFRTTASTEEQRRLCDVIIEPDIEGLSALAFDRATEWVARGEAAAREALPQILALAGEARARGSRHLPPIRIDSTYVHVLTLEGLHLAPSRSVARTLGLEIPGWITRQEVDRAIGSAYSSGFFASVTYRIDALQRGDSVVSALVVRFEEEKRDRLGFSFRYETRYKASLLMSTTLRNLLQYGSVTRLDLRLGQQIQLGGQYTRRSGPRNALSLGVRAEWSEAPLDFFEDGRRVAEVRVDAANLSAFFGVAFSNTALAGISVKGEYAYNRATITAETFDEKDTFYTLAALVRADTYDRDAFPSRGFGLLLKSEWADRSIGSGRSFSHSVFDADLYLPLHRRASLIVRATLGSSSGGDDLPTHYLFFLGGSSPYFIFPDRQFPFFGLETHERRGRHIQSFQLGLRLQIAERFFAILRLNAGDTLDRWHFDPDQYLTGYGLTLGVRTPFGPISATIAETTLEEWPDFSVDLGYLF